MFYIEYVIPLPFTLDQYRVGYLWSQLEFSKQETGGGSGVEFIEHRQVTEPEPGKYTHRVYYLEKKFPRIVTTFVPLKYFQVHETSTSFSNYTETKYSHEDIAPENFGVSLQSTSSDKHHENIFELTSDQLKLRKSVFIDISQNYNAKFQDYDERSDPTQFKSEKLSFGPLSKITWLEDKNCPNILYIHKMYSVNVAVPGFNHIKPKIIENLTRMMYKFYRQMFCWCDIWLPLSLQQVEAMEQQVKQELLQLRADKEARGIS